MPVCQSVLTLYSTLLCDYARKAFEIGVPCHPQPSRQIYVDRKAGGSGFLEDVKPSWVRLCGCLSSTDKGPGGHRKARPWAADPVPALGVLQKLEEQEQQAQRLKEKLRSQQQSLQQQLEQLQRLPGAGERERLRAHSLDSSVLSSERSDSDQGECPTGAGLGGGV